MSHPDALLLIGPTGAGKTPLGELLEREGLPGRRCVHFDFGRGLRLIAAADDPPAPRPFWSTTAVAERPC